MLFLGFDIFSTLVVFLLTLIITWGVASWLQTPANLPPYPGRPLPIVGHLLYMKNDFRVSFLEFKKKAGDIFCLYFGGFPVIFLSSYEVLKEAMVKQGDLFIERPLGGIVSIIEERLGMINTDGATWKENRNFFVTMSKAFFRGKDVITDKVLDEVVVYLQDLDELKGKPVDIHVKTGCAVANITCNFLYGKRFDNTDPFFLKFVHDVDELMARCGQGAILQWLPFLKYLPGDLFGARRTIEVKDELIETVRKMIQMVKDREGNDIADFNMIACYLEKMEQLRAEGQPTELSEDHLEWLVLDIMVGGAETTATTLAWFYLYLLHYPDVQDKIYAEILEEIGLRSPLGKDQLKLHYVNAVILETHRFSTISPIGILHRCNKETTVAGYTIPEDAYVITHLDAILGDEKLWGDPKTFRPERFLQDGKVVKPEFYVPFGIGRRECPGQFLAKTEMFLFVVSVLQRFKVEPVDPNNLPPCTHELGATCPPTPYKLRFVPREN